MIFLPFRSVEEMIAYMFKYFLRYVLLSLLNLLFLYLEKKQLCRTVFQRCYRAGEMDFKVGEGEGDGTLKSIVSRHGWSTRKTFEF